MSLLDYSVLSVLLLPSNSFASIYTVSHLCTEQRADTSQVSNWFINARRRAPQKEQREREANGPEA
jgi:hypothetical protein